MVHFKLLYHRDIIKKVKRQATNREGIFAMHLILARISTNIYTFLTKDKHCSQPREKRLRTAIERRGNWIDQRMEEMMPSLTNNQENIH